MVNSAGKQALDQGPPFSRSANAEPSNCTRRTGRPNKQLLKFTGILLKALEHIASATGYKIFPSNDVFNMEDVFPLRCVFLEVLGDDGTSFM